MIVHAAFVVFVVAGGALVWRWPRFAWLHLPAAAWGAAIEFGGWICPLTPLENYFRERAQAPTYQGDFVAHYVMPVLYPSGLTRTRQIWFGMLAIAINLCIYACVIGRARWLKARDHR